MQINVLQGDYFVLKHNLTKRPDGVTFDGSTFIGEQPIGSESWKSCGFESPLYNLIKPFTSRPYELWGYDSNTSQISISVCGASKGRSWNQNWNFQTFKCFYDDCMHPPPDPNTAPPVDKRPENYRLWSDTTIWVNDGGVVTNLATLDRNYVPQNGDNVTIAKGKI